MKQNTNLIGRMVVCAQLFLLGAAGFMWQSCDKSDIPPEDRDKLAEILKKELLHDTLSSKKPDSTLAMADSLALTGSNAATQQAKQTLTAAAKPPAGSPGLNPPVVFASAGNVAPAAFTANYIVTSQGITLNPPQDLFIGVSQAYPLATDTYGGLLNQMPVGENEFWFYGKTTQYGYPGGEWVTQANGYSTIDLPTHAVNARAGSDGTHPEYNDVICRIEYIIRDAQGNIVMYCKDTKGGFHPSFMADKRGNNHPKESQRFLPYGTYTVEFRNLTEGNVNAPLRVTYNRAGGSMGEYFDAIVNNQSSVTFAINVFEQYQDMSMFKLNCNLVP